MDALSKFFDDIHLNKSEYIYLKAQGEWAFKTQDQSALLAYIVLTGSVYIQLISARKDPPSESKRHSLTPVPTF